MSGRATQYSSHASFVLDPQSIDKDGGRQIDWANVAEKYRLTPGGTVTLTANAAIDAVALAVVALLIPVKSGTLLHFGESKEFARVTADAAVGATALTVEALPAAIESGDAAIVKGEGKKILPAGAVMGELIDLTAGGPGKVSPRVVTTNPAIGLLASDAVEDDPAAALSGYGLVRGGIVYEALLPDATGTPRILAAAIKTELAANSKGFVYAVYKDVR